MTRLSAARLIVAVLARALLLFYPTAFRRAHRADFIDTAMHRWKRELLRTNSASAATTETVSLLAADTVAAAPRLWRSALGRSLAPTALPGRTAMLALMSGLAGDVRLAARAAYRQAAFSLFVVATLAIGLGASTAAFGALDRSILRPLPFPDGDRFVFVVLEHSTLRWQSTPPADLVATWRAGATAIDRFEVHRSMNVTRAGADGADLITVLGVSGGLPGMLGVTPVAGRLLGPEDARHDAPDAVMVSESFWKREFGGASNAIGRVMRLNGKPYTIAGVWPGRARIDPRGMPPLIRVLRADEQLPRGTQATVLGRIREGASVDQAETEIAVLAQNWPDLGLHMRPVLRAPYGRLGEAYVRGLWLVFTGAFVLMLVGIANAANLLLARATARADEVSLRLALGASRSRLVRLFTAESLILAAGGLAGGYIVGRAVGALIDVMEPRSSTLDAAAWSDGRTVEFAAAACALATVACTLAPALAARRSRLRPGLTPGRATARRAVGRAMLVAVQSALAVVLVVGAALMARSFANLRSIDPGFDIERLAVLSVNPPQDRYPTPAARESFLTRVQESLGSIPGVSGITTANMPPFTSTMVDGLPYLEGEAAPPVTGDTFTASTSARSNHFEVLGIPLLGGRLFTREDRTGVVIVNDAFARSRGGDVLGRTLLMQGRAARIVGIVGNVRSFGLSDEPDRVQLYYPTRPNMTEYTRFVVRTSGDPGAVVRAARSRLAEIDREVPWREAEAGPDLLARQTARHRFVAVILAVLSAMGLILAVTGVYAAVSLEVSRRKRDVGVRMALGATARQVARQVLQSGLAPVVPGALAGAIAALWAAPLLEHLVFGMQARDMISVIAGVAIMGSAAAAGCMLPALRATRTNPADILRSE
jgi:predicted permease